MGTAGEGNGALVLCPLGPPRAVSIVAAMRARVRDSGISMPPSHVAPQPGAPDALPTLDASAAAACAHARNMYAGVADAWAWSAQASVARTLASLCARVGPVAALAPDALPPLFRAVRLALGSLTAVRSWPLALPAAGGSATQAGEATASSRSAAVARSSAPSPLFVEAATATRLRMAVGSSISRGSAWASGDDGASTPGLGGLAGLSGSGVHVAPGGLGAALTAFSSSVSGGGSNAAPLENPASAASGTAIAFSPDDAAQYSPAGVSLAACALARRSVLHCAAGALAAAAALPLHSLEALPLRASALVAASALLSGGALALEPMELGLCVPEPPPRPLPRSRPPT